MMAAMAAGSVSAEPARLTLRAEAGAEYDTNTERAEIVDGASVPARVASPLGRMVVQGGAAGFPGRRHELSLTGLAAAKLFMADAATSEDVLVVSGGGHYHLRAGERLSVGAAASYYDAFQRGRSDARDFRSAAAFARAMVQAGAGGALTVAAGWRRLTFKPDRDFDFDAPAGSIEYDHLLPGADGGAEWELSVGASAEQRRFAGRRMVLACALPACTPMPGAGQRADLFALAHAGVTRVGALLAGARYALNLNRSNSYGEGLLRHMVQIRAAVELPGSVYLAARADVIYTTYFDRVVVARSAQMMFVSIEDESRNSLQLEATRDLGRHVQAIARYAVYGRAFGISLVDYRRQTASLAVAFWLDR